MTSLLKDLLKKRGITFEENQEDKAPSGAEVSTGSDTGATPETATASPEVVDDSAIHGEPGTNDNQAAPAEGGTADPETPAPQAEPEGTQGQEDGGAAGASVEGGLGEPQVTPDDISGEAVEGDDEVEQADVDEAEEAVAETEEVTASMEALIDRIKGSVASGGLTARESAVAQTRASNVLKRLGIDPVLFPAQENFSNSGERVENTRLVIGALEKAKTKVSDLKASFTTVLEDRKARLAKK